MNKNTMRFETATRNFVGKELTGDEAKALVSLAYPSVPENKIYLGDVVGVMEGGKIVHRQPSGRGVLAVILLETKSGKLKVLGKDEIVRPVGAAGETGEAFADVKKRMESELLKMQTPTSKQ
jgi:hypothetical protein